MFVVRTLVLSSGRDLLNMYNKTLPEKYQDFSPYYERKKITPNKSNLFHQ